MTTTFFYYTSPFKPPRQTAVSVVCHIWRDSVMTREAKALAARFNSAPRNQKPKAGGLMPPLMQDTAQQQQNKTARTSQRCVPVAGIIETVEGGKGSRRT